MQRNTQRWITEDAALQTGSDMHHETDSASVPAGAPILSEQLLEALMSGPELTARHLRAIEFLLVRVCTVALAGRATRVLRPEPEVDAFLDTLALAEPTDEGTLCCQQYLALCRILIATPSPDGTTIGEVLCAARALKYRLGECYLEREVLKAAVQCLTLMVQISAEVSPPVAQERFRRTVCLPLEPLPPGAERSGRPKPGTGARAPEARPELVGCVAGARRNTHPLRMLQPTVLPTQLDLIVEAEATDGSWDILELLEYDEQPRTIAVNPSSDPFLAVLVIDDPSSHTTPLEAGDPASQSAAGSSVRSAGPVKMPGSAATDGGVLRRRTAAQPMLPFVPDEMLLPAMDRSASAATSRVPAPDAIQPGGPTALEAAREAARRAGAVPGFSARGQRSGGKADAQLPLTGEIRAPGNYGPSTQAPVSRPPAGADGSPHSAAPAGRQRTTSTRRTAAAGRGSPVTAPTGFGPKDPVYVWLWRTGCWAFILLNVLTASVLSARLLLEPTGPEPVASPRYAAYRLPDSLARLPLESARRVDRMLVLTARNDWFTLTARARQDLVAHLAKHLLAPATIDTVLIIDSQGRRLAFATPTQAELVSGLR